ncbi:MAG: di-trans,poly-cis-decaprenylcistransferase [Clostridia bacterium]|nr:di-trans,poly-cis-decaprenylcistransferase [Clostridia bacterium]
MTLQDIDINRLPQHIAIIMDGNRTWAREKGLDPKLGHKEGAKTLEKIVRYANKIGIKYLTVYAFSTENWNRTKEEVGALMLLLGNYLDDFSKRADTENVKIQVLGDVSTLSSNLQNSINKAIERTKNNTGVVFNVAFNYGGRAELVMATKKIAKLIQNKEMSMEDITEETITNNLYTSGQPDPELLIRTSGQIRTSGFLPWQTIYSEFVFVKKNWPDFTEEDLLETIKEYQTRTIKKGK